MEVDSSSNTTPGAFPTTNGVNGVNGDSDHEAPKPPPHDAAANGSTESSSAEDAEACKAAGNKFFKAKQYDKAIAEYTKGAV